MTDAIVVAVVTGGLSLAGTLFGSYLSHKKSIALILYRLEQLEDKVNKHNNLIDRTYCLEKRCDLHEEKIKVANHRIDDLEESV